MHVCFHGGGSDGRAGATIAKSIRDFTKILIGRGGDDRARRRQTPRCKDTTTPAAASAKIAPAQLQEEEEEVLHGGGGKRQEFCDKCCSALPEAAAAEGEGEWEAEPEPGMVLTLAARRDGVSNRLRRIRFREEAFDAWAAQCWWADNHDRIAELYSLAADDSSSSDSSAAADAMLPATPCHSEAEEEEEEDGAIAGAESSSRSPSTSTSTFSGGPSSGSGGGESAGTVGSPILGLVTDKSGGYQQPAAAWSEWVEEYEAGVFITVRAYPGHRLQLRCVELRRERFGEVKARVWRPGCTTSTLSESQGLVFIFKAISDDLYKLQVKFKILLAAAANHHFFTSGGT